MYRNDLARWLSVFVASLLLAGAADASAASAKDKRKAILDKLGMEHAPPKEDDAEVVEAPADAEADAGKTKADKASQATKARRVYFDPTAHAVLMKKCHKCHKKTDGKAGGLHIVGDMAADYASAKKFTKVGNPDSSLLTKARGVEHKGRATIKPDSTEYGTLSAWVMSGAKLRPGGAKATATSTTNESTRAVAAQSSEQATASEPATEEPASKPAPETPGATLVLYAPKVHAVLNDACASCHEPDGMAEGSGYVTTGDAAADFASARATVFPGKPDESSLLLAAKGMNDHSGGAAWDEGAPEYDLIAAWIAGGALGEAPKKATTVAEAESGKEHHAARDKAPHHPHHTQGLGDGTMMGVYSQPKGRPSGTEMLGFSLPGNLRLNGRFDVNYEHYSDGRDALQSYHHFVFLSRDAQDDPFGLTVEIIDRTFWEAYFQHHPEGKPWRVLVKMGKMLIPFGSDPLFHQMYGGQAGFDQKVLPPIWAELGVSGRFEYNFESIGLTVANDAYGVRGYRLRQPDGILNLQGDSAPLEDVNVAFGDRLGVSWGPFNAWYSLYTSKLGFGRRLFMQGLDLMLNRIRGVPVLDRVSAGVGFLRADVSGGNGSLGGNGDDYYHFASYYWLRFFPTHWSYIQYRAGLRTFNNREGLFEDDRFFTGDDGTSHNVAVGVRYRGVSLAAFYFWQLEKTDEVDNDYFRLTLAYEF